MRRASLDLEGAAHAIDESTEIQDDQDTDMDVDLSMPPDEDESEVPEQDVRAQSLPPRVAARFYRPSQARRRDSAASSRRNSMSSSHSRCSSAQAVGSGPGEDQSKSVAQHLRRASFLEDRRARLADRAAHAEKVRRRAAMAKAAPRGSTSSEERALAAKEARERNLAEIVASCAEEVNKARQVAEFMKEKREREHVAMKAQMQERLAEADRRREEIRNRNAARLSRGQGGAARKPLDTTLQAKEAESGAPSRPMTEEIATARIQDWWRGTLKQRAIQAYAGLGLSVDGIRDTSFEKVVETLAEEKVLFVAARLLRICGLREGEPRSVEELAAVRIFLSAYLILGHPNQVLSSKSESQDDPEESPLEAFMLPSADLENPQLQELVRNAKDVLVCFENILARLTAANRYTMPPALADELPKAYAVFHNTFIAWKSRDSNALVEIMVMQFVELDAILETVKDSTDDGTEEVYQQSIKDHQMKLIVRVKQLAGKEPGKKMIFGAVREARKARALKKKRAADSRPRVAEGFPGMPAAPPPGSGNVAPGTQKATPEAGPANKSQLPPIDFAIGLLALLPNNRSVLHEIAINREYQVPTEEYRENQAGLYRPIYNDMRRAMLAEDKEETFELFMTLAINIKDKLQHLLKAGNSIWHMINDIFDTELAVKQFQMGSFSYERFFVAMTSLLPKLCAPVRDPDLQKLTQELLSDKHVVDRIETLMSFIDMMRCDHINYLISFAAQRLVHLSTDYESSHFTKEVESGRYNLASAKASWRAARAKTMAEVQRRDPEGINHARSRPTASQIYAQMLVDCFTQPTPIPVQQVPEMLLLDVARMEKVSTMVRHIVTAGAVLLQCKNLLKRDVRSPWKLEAARVMSVLEANHPTVEAAVQGTMAALEAGRSMPAMTKTHLRALVTKVLTASRELSASAAEPREPVLRLLLTRLRANILSRLVPGSAVEKIRATTTGGEKLATLGMSEFVDTVRQISDLLEKVGSVDRLNHGQWWNTVADKVVEDEAAAAEAAAAGAVAA